MALEYAALTTEMVNAIKQAVGAAQQQAAIAQDMTRAGFEVQAAKNQQKNWEGVKDLVR